MSGLAALPPVRAVLLDVDGTLVDSNQAHTESWVWVLRDAGFDVVFDQVRPLIGMGGDKLLPRLTGIESDSRDGKRLTRARWECFRDEFIPWLRPTCGAAALITRLHAAGVKPVVATSAQADEADAILEQAGLAKLLGRRTSSDDAEDSKPDPDIIHAALRRAHVDAGDAVMVGDTPYDVEAARRAGVRAIALRCGGWWSDEDFRGADAILDDPAALCAMVPGGAGHSPAQGLSLDAGGR